MLGRSSRTLLAVALLGLGGLMPVRAQAGEPSAADKETARSLLISGREKLAAQDYQGAREAFAAAYELVQVPTTALDLARAQAALGMLVEARTTALEAARMPEAPREPAAFRDARLEASTLAEGLGERIPSLRVKVQGLPAGTAPVVQLDGEAVPAETLAFPRKVDPGAHEVVASAAGHAEQRRKVEVKEAETAEVLLTLHPAGPLAPGAAPAPAKPDGPLERKVPIWAWMSLGVGGAWMAMGVGFLIDGLNAKARLDELGCKPNNCDLEPDVLGEARRAYKRYDLAKPASLAFGLVGLAGMTAGVVGIVLAPKVPASPSVAAVPWVGPGSGGLVAVGRF